MKGGAGSVRELRPYRTGRGALRALDNGGRFFNLFARAGDRVVNSAELARAAGVFSPGMNAFLHFEMALMDLAPAERELIVSSLASDLLARYGAERPTILAPSLVESQGEAGAPTIVTGYPVFIEDRTEFGGFVMLVIKTVMIIPIYDQFDVYEVFDTPECVQPRTVIATARGSKRLDGVTTRFGGVLKELYFDDETGRDHGHYVEVAYYTPLRWTDSRLTQA
jgi:hypothetical protein